MQNNHNASGYVCSAATPVTNLGGIVAQKYTDCCIMDSNFKFCLIFHCIFTTCPFGTECVRG